jgi:hypothetical protein
MMYDRVKKKFYGLEKHFDRWWNKKKGGHYLSQELKKTHTFWNDPRSKIRKRILIHQFNKYSKTHALE